MALSNKKSMKYFFIFFISLNFFSYQANAIVPDVADADYPPEQNPHPPVTEEDKKRVEFADKVVWNFLQTDLKIKEVPKKPVGTIVDKSSECVTDLACYSKDKAFVLELIDTHKVHGVLIDKKFGHIVPWSFQRFQKNKNSLKNSTSPAAQNPIESILKNDEYLVHFYARFANSKAWYHVYVIVTENEKGGLFFRNFYIYIMDKTLQRSC